MPWNVEDWLESFENQDPAQAETFLRLVLEAWPTFADGHNQLGRCALHRDEHEAALAHFARALEVGRALFPKRIAKSRWWTDLDTRPYLRAMRGTVRTLLEAGRSEEALTWCDRMETECFDVPHAQAARAVAALNLGAWALAMQSAQSVVQRWPEYGFVLAYAFAELKRQEEASAAWRVAEDAMPLTAALLGGTAPWIEPTDWDQARQIDAAEALMRSMASFRKGLRRRRLAVGQREAGSKAPGQPVMA